MNDLERRQRDAEYQRLADKIADADDYRARKRLREMWEITPSQQRFYGWVVVVGVIVIVLILWPVLKGI